MTSKRAKAPPPMAAAEAKDYLLTILTPGDTVFTVLDKVTSDVSRVIRVVVIKNACIEGKSHADDIHPNAAVASVLGLDMTESGTSIVVPGCGEDMGRWLTHELSRALFGNGFVLNHRWL